MRPLSFRLHFKFPHFSPSLQPLLYANSELPSKQSRGKGVCLHIHPLFSFSPLSVCQILPKGVVSVIGPASSPASGSTVSHICGEKEVSVEDKHTYLCTSESFSARVCYHCYSRTSYECWSACCSSPHIIKHHPLFSARITFLNSLYPLSTLMNYP